MFKSLEVRRNVRLAPYTTLQIGGPADFLAFPPNTEILFELLKEARSHAIPTYFLGGGSNLLISDNGVRGLVIQLAGEFDRVVARSPTQLQVGAAYSNPKLTRLCLDLGFEKALGLCGVPGSVGGALRMNAGTRLWGIGDLVKAVDVLTPQGPLTLTRDQMGFSYRHTNLPVDMVVCGAYLACQDAHADKKPELLQRAQELAKRRKATQPKQRSAGSMFKNPSGDYAGRLVEACGLKGFSVGGAQISTVHANFFVNLNHATAQDMLTLGQITQEKVYDQLGVKLEYEIKRWGF